jgi:hypothetical protein
VVAAHEASDPADQQFTVRRRRPDAMVRTARKATLFPFTRHLEAQARHATGPPDRAHRAATGPELHASDTGPLPADCADQPGWWSSRTRPSTRSGNRHPRGELDPPSIRCAPSGS